MKKLLIRIIASVLPEYANRRSNGSEGEWNPERISLWARSEFGEHTPLEIAIRANKEMGELLSCLSNRQDDAAIEEIADVYIILCQSCYWLGADLQEEVDRKMRINLNRTWGKASDGSFQHL